MFASGTRENAFLTTRPLRPLDGDGRRLRHDHEGTVEVVGELVTRAPQEQLRETAAAALSGDDQIRALVLRPVMIAVAGVRSVNSTRNGTFALESGAHHSRLMTSRNSSRSGSDATGSGTDPKPLGG